MGHPLRLSRPCVPVHPPDRAVFPFDCHTPAGSPGSQRSPKTSSRCQRIRRKPPLCHGPQGADPCSLRSPRPLRRDPQHQDRPRSSPRWRLRFCPMRSPFPFVDSFATLSDDLNSLPRALLSLSLLSTLNLPRHSLVVPSATKGLGPYEPFFYHTGR